MAEKPKVLQEFDDVKTRVKRVNDEVAREKAERGKDEMRDLRMSVSGRSNTYIKSDQEDLDAIRKEFLDIINSFIIRYFIAKSPFLGNLVTDVAHKVDFLLNSSLAANSDNDSNRIVFAYNPLWIFSDVNEYGQEQDISMRNIIAIVLNELSKMVYESYSFIGKHSGDPKDRRVAVAAAEAASYESILDDIIGNKESSIQKAEVPANAWTSYSIGQKCANQRPDRIKPDSYYYDFILQHMKKKDLTDLQGGGSQQGEGESQQGGGSQQGEGESQQGGGSQRNDGSAGSGKSVPGDVSTPQNRNGHDPYDQSQADLQNLNDSSNTLIKNDYNSSDRGFMPGGMKSKIDRMMQPPEIPWNREFRNMLGSIPGDKKKTRMRPNRRLPGRPDLPGDARALLVKIVIAIDTSGSMSDPTIAKCLNEVSNICQSYHTEITVIECDSEIGKVYRIDDPKDINYTVTGRGGTSYKPVIDYINADKYFRDAVMIYFTDGYGDGEIDRPLDYKNLWVVIGSRDYFSLSRPYGVVKHIRGTDEDY